MNKRAFKGVWICAELWTHPDLSPIEIMLLAEIDSLTSDDNPCFASNEHLAASIKVSPTSIRNILSRLQSAGFIHRVGFNGRTAHRVVDPSVSSNPATSKNWLKTSSANECRVRRRTKSAFVRERTIDTQKRVPLRKENKEKTGDESPEPPLSVSSSAPQDFKQLIRKLKSPGQTPDNSSNPVKDNP